MPMPKKQRIPRSCLECGQEFLAPPWEVERGNARYCCASHARSHTQRTGRKTARATCKMCGLSFIYAPYGKTPVREFCGNKCTATYYGQIRSASVGSIDSRGKVRELVRRDQRMFREIVKIVGKRQQCGAIEKLHAHHIIERHKRPDLRWEPSNIEVLCTTCHAGHHPGIAPLILASMNPKRPAATKTCATCGVEFRIKRNRLDRAIWCSKKCRGGQTRETFTSGAVP